MIKRSLSRGTSIVAALALVGVLGIALVFAQIILPDTHTRSQLAATATATAAPTAVKSDVQKACDQAKQEAAEAAGAPKAASVSGTSKSLSDQCVGAYFKPQPGAKDPTNKKLPENYTCSGKRSTVSITGGNLNEKSVTDPSVTTPGLCRVTACTTSSGKLTCFNADLVGYDKSKIQNILSGQNPDISTFGATPQTVNQLYDSNLIPRDQRDAAGLNDAFAQQQGLLNSQIDSQQKAADDAQAKLDQIARTCAEDSGDSTCQAQVAAAQQDVAKQQQQLQDMKDQKAAFAASTQNDLKPGDKPTDSSNPDWCNQGGKGTTDCAGGPDSKLCPSGQVGTPPNCRAGSSSFPPAQPPAPQAPQTDKGGGLGDIGKALQGFLGGLMKGLGGAGGAAAGPACPSDPSAYAQQQQQYQAQMQQYQYQMRQYQYQQQYGGDGYQVVSTNPVVVVPTGGSGYMAPPAAPVACTPSSSSNTCAATPAQPTTPCPSGTVLKPVTSQGSNGATCTTGWQCGASTATAPVAQLSCQPQVADAGMSVTISYGCTNAVSSTGSGFSTGGATSGSTTTVITAPPTGINKATFGITCINQNLSGQASCDVQVGRTSIVLLANPRVVATSTPSTIGWVTSGMSSCVVSSPQQADFTAANAGNTSVNGMATTSPITRDTTILLHCVTLGGGTRDATTTIISSAAGSGDQTGSVTITSSADGTSIARGAVNTISWSSTGVPAGSKMSLWLYDVRLNAVTALIKNELSASSTYAWTLPTPDQPCSPDLNFVCGTDLIPGRQYGIEADLYTGTPGNASYGAQAYTSHVFTITQ